ncbi:hypothetical protein WJX82_007947 [Trebouxia sp. C0006]
MQEAFWQKTLQACYPVWAASGVSSAPAGCGPTWRQLVAAATRLQPPGLHDNSHMWPDYSPAITKQLWNSGLEGSKLDFHLCHAVNAVDQQASMGLVCQEEVLSARMNFVCFLLFSQRQLARAAKILMQMLATIMQPANHDNQGEPETVLQYNGWDTTRVAASASSFLIELLHMRTASSSPMSVKSPQEFLEACQDPSRVAARLPETDTFEYCQMLLDTLASAAAAVGGGVFGCSSRLMRRSFPFEEQLFQSTPIPGYGACQLQQIYAGALLLARPGVDDLSQAIQSHGLDSKGDASVLTMPRWQRLQSKLS